MFVNKPKFITSKDIYDSVEKLGKISNKTEEKEVEKRKLIESLVEDIQITEVEQKIEKTIEQFTPFNFSSKKKEKKDLKTEYAGSDILWLK